MQRVKILSTFQHILRLTARGSVIMIVAIGLSVMPTVTVVSAALSSSELDKIFTEAAQKYQVPKELLVAVGYEQSRLESYEGMSADGGSGVMALRTKVPLEDHRHGQDEGNPDRPIPHDAMTKGPYTLDEAANLTGIPQETLKTDTRANIDGAAAVLADKAKKLNEGSLPKNLEGWYSAVAAFNSDSNAAGAAFYVAGVYENLKKGLAVRTADGQQLSTPAAPTLEMPDLTQLSNLGLDLSALSSLKSANNGTDCPVTINCRFIPAAYTAFSDDPADFGNYDHANRPHDMKIQYIIVHDTEGPSPAGAIARFQDQSYVSAHYIIDSKTGEVTQMVKAQDVAWHARDWYLNMHSIGIEHTGFAAAGSKWYTETMYRTSAELVRYLARKYQIPLDRAHILGHDNMPSLTDERLKGQHHDPGPRWDWNYYMDLLHGRKASTNVGFDFFNFLRHRAARPGDIVTINPVMAQNLQTVKVCKVDSPEVVTDPNVCKIQTEPSNFVYMREEPRPDAPLLEDPIARPDGSPGSDRISDWTSKATAGQQYVLAEKQGDWTAVWFAGQKAWFYNPTVQPTAIMKHKKAITIQLKPGLAEAHVYGGALPEENAFPAEVRADLANLNYPLPPILAYTIKSGQEYVAYDDVSTDLFYDATVDYSKPYDHEVFRGSDKYYRIWYNQRVMFVKATDVIAVR